MFILRQLKVNVKVFFKLFYLTSKWDELKCPVINYKDIFLSGQGTLSLSQKVKSCGVSKFGICLSSSLSFPSPSILIILDSNFF